MIELNIIVYFITFKFSFQNLKADGSSLLSYASYAVGYMELNEEQKSKDYVKQMSNYFNEPFQVFKMCCLENTLFLLLN
jgi:hypothetical protein